MPKLHYPLRGGLQMSGQSSPPSEAPGEGCGQCHQLKTELDRLRQELSHARRSPENRQGGQLAGLPMVWAALGLCGGVILFALLALMKHG